MGEAKNIIIKKNQNTITTNTWILTFNLPVPPQEIKIPCFSNMKVTPYVPKPMICDRCHKLGHTKNRCKHYADQRCENCGEKAYITEKIIGPRPGQTEAT